MVYNTLFIFFFNFYLRPNEQIIDVGNFPFYTCSLICNKQEVVNIKSFQVGIIVRIFTL